MDFETILRDAGFTAAGTCQCGGTLNKIYRKAGYEIRVQPNRRPQTFRLSKAYGRGQMRPVYGGPIEALTQTINQHVR